MPFLKNKKQEIANLLSNTFFDLKNLLDEETSYIYLDSLWIKAELFRKSSNFIRDFLEKKQILNQATSIMAADKLKYPFGIIPIASVISLTEEKDLLIWKEQGDFLTGKPLVYGHGTQDITNVIILHDVFLGGYSIIKMIESLRHIEEKHNKKCEIINICSLVNLANESVIERTIDDINKRTNKKIKADNLLFILDLSAFWDWEEGA